MESYYSKNREVKLKYQKLYNETNKEERKAYMSEYHKQKYTCECGSIFRHDSLYIHRKGKKHNEYLQNKLI
jgi:hypothetical protein